MSTPTSKPELMPSSASNGRPRTPSDLDIPTFLLNVPFGFNTIIANNKWMEEYPSDEDRAVNFYKAYSQWLDLYGELSAEGLVYILPTPPDSHGLQDLVFVGNLGVIMSHLRHKPVIISKFKSEPRHGEEIVGRAFFSLLGYFIYSPPHFFEGEAELKYLYDNIYLGGYGQRSSKEAYDWMENEFGAKVIKLEEVDEYFYHLDCTVFPATRSDTLFCTKMYSHSEVKAVERVTNIIDVPEDACLQGITNSVRVGNVILNASNIHELKKSSDDYKAERAKNRLLEDIASDLALEVKFVNLSEFLKGGALLSCMVMHLNRESYNFSLV